jgi:hypothetical protein
MESKQNIEALLKNYEEARDKCEKPTDKAYVQSTIDGLRFALGHGLKSTKQHDWHEEIGSPSAHLPELPPRLKSATLASAENLTAIAHSEGIKLADKRLKPLPHLETMLYLIREGCIDVEKGLTLYLGNQWIKPSEIAAVLETIAAEMVSDNVEELAGHNASWYLDAANVVEQMAYG